MASLLEQPMYFGTKPVYHSNGAVTVRNPYGMLVTLQSNTNPSSSDTLSTEDYKKRVEEYNEQAEQYEHIKCPLCRSVARLNRNPSYSITCPHTPKQLREYQELQARQQSSTQGQADSQVTKKCEGCAVRGGTKKKSRRLRRRKSKSKIQRRGKSVKRRRQ